MANFDPACPFPTTMLEDELMAWVKTYARSSGSHPNIRKFRYFEKDEKGQKIPLDVWLVTFGSGSGYVFTEAYFFRRDLFSGDAFDASRRRESLREIPIKSIGSVAGHWSDNPTISFSPETKIMKVTARYLKEHSGFGPYEFDPNRETTVMTINLNYF